MVNQNLEQLEEHIDKAESDFGSFSSVRKLLSSVPLPSFFSKKSASGASKQSPKDFRTYEPPEIFHTEDYFSVPNGADTSTDKFSQSCFKLSDQLPAHGEDNSLREKAQQIDSCMADLAIERAPENCVEMVKDAAQSTPVPSGQPSDNEKDHQTPS